MLLLTKKNRKDLSPIYSNENTPQSDVMAYVKLFTPDANWTWYITEIDKDNPDILFGLVIGQSTELGFFSLKELSAVRGPLGLPIERDKYFSPQTIGMIKRAEGI